MENAYQNVMMDISKVEVFAEDVVNTVKSVVMKTLV
jgi:hypothetical protein